MAETLHASDCPVNRGPALPVGPCDCEARAEDEWQSNCPDERCRTKGKCIAFPLPCLADTTEWGSFSIIQGGMTVASGSGPLEQIRSEAAHYAAVYRQDGPVRVRVRKLKPLGYSRSRGQVRDT